MRLIKAAAAATALVCFAVPARAGEVLLLDTTPPVAADRAAPARAEMPAAVAPDQSEAPAAAPAPPPPLPMRTVPFAAINDGPIFSKSDASANKVDESALRYYASQKNHPRVEAEIRRLKTLYPGWKVPNNLYTPAGNGTDEQTLWDLFSANKLDQLRAAISLRMLQDSAWHPSADLSSKMAVRDANDRLRSASDAKAWSKVLDVANTTPAMLTCANIDSDWRVAEAFAQTGATDRAFDIDRAILSSCTDRDERLATVRKAVMLLPIQKVEMLIAMGAVLSDGSHEFDAVRVDLIRGQVGKFAGGETTVEVPPEALKLFTDTAAATSNVPDSTLLGWYFFRLKRWGDSDEWFKTGLAVQADDPKIQEGHVLALRNLGQLDEAKALASKWRENSPALRGLYTGFLVAEITREKPAPNISDKELTDFTTTVNTDHLADGAQALAWYNYNRKTWDQAATWFKSSIDWTAAKAAEQTDDKGDARPGPAVAVKPDPKVIVGYALSLQNLNRLDDAEQVAYSGVALGSDVRQLYISIMISAMTKSGAAIAPERIGRLAEVVKTEHSVPGASALGWFNLGANQFLQSIDWFSAANVWTPDGKGDAKINEGLALALKGAGRFAAAEDLAYDWLPRSPDMRAVYRDTVIVELTRDDLAASLTEGRLNRFETIVEKDKLGGGAQALGWFRLHQQACGYAVGWFRKAVAWSPDTQGDAKINEGLAQSLQLVGHYAEAEDVAYAWKDRSPDLKALFIKIAVDVLTREVPVIATTEPRLGRYAEVILAEKSANGAQALAWHRFRDTNYGYGAQWFALALQWSPDGRGDAKMNEGYALALRNVGNLRMAEEVLIPWVDRVPTMRGIYIDVMVSQLTGDSPPMPMDDPRMMRFISVITPIRNALGAQAIAWYRHSRVEETEAAKWFRTALDWWPTLSAEGDRIRDPVLDDYQPITAKLALTLPDYRRTPRAFGGRRAEVLRNNHPYVDTFTGLATTWTGYVMALNAIGRSAEAEEIAYAWRDRWPAMHDLFLTTAVAALTKTDPAPQIAPERLKRYTDLIETERTPNGAQGLGWYSMNRQNWAEAAVWFKAALDWTPGTGALDAKPDLNLDTGYVLALRRLKRFDEAMAIAAPLRTLSPAMATLYLETSLDQLSGGGATEIPADRMADLSSTVLSTKSVAGSSSLGWYFYGQKDYAKALTWFRQAVTWAPDGKVDPKSAQGLTLAYRALGRTQDAFTFASAWRERIPGLDDLLPGIMAELLSQDNSNVTLPADQMAKVTSLITSMRSAAGAQALAWNSYAHKDWTAAAEWFKAAMTWSPDGKGDAKLAEGYASALRNLGRYDESEAVAYSWYNTPDGGPLRTAYVDTVSEQLAKSKPPVSMSSDDLQKFATATLETQSANGAQALGWYSYNSGQFKPAIAWFTKALAWDASEGEALGLALSYRRSNDIEGYNSTLDSYRDKYPRIGELLKGNPKTRTAAPPVTIRDPGRVAFNGSAPRAVAASSGGAAAGSAAAALQAKDYTRCLDRVDDAQKGGRAGTDLMQIKGWCLLGLDRGDEAAIAFGQAQAGQQGKKREDSAYGESLSLLRSGKTDAAAQVAGSATLSAQRRNDIGMQVLTQRVFKSYASQRWADTLAALNQRAAYAPETRDLRLARGWSLFHLGDYDASRRVFTDVNNQLSDRESQQALTVLDGTIDPRRKY